MRQFHTLLRSEHVLLATLCASAMVAGCTVERPKNTATRSERRTPEVATAVNALYTSNAGRKYRRECEDAGVPLPNRVLDGSWVNHGVIDDPFVSQGYEAELWSWSQTTGDRGICLALPRWNDDSPRRAVFFGVICMGTDSSKACFFDNPNGTWFKEGSTKKLSAFVAGDDLVGNLQGVCTDCHSGENPFVVHPEKEAFANLLAEGSRALLMRPVSGWHEPLVPASGSPQWPENPGPETRLASIPSENDCTACHSVPIVSTSLTGYCNDVLTPATSRSLAASNTADETMPTVDIYTRAGYSGSYQDYRETYRNHYETMLNVWCKAPPPSDVGEVITVPGTNDPGVISPPIVAQPIYACSRAVRVISVIPGATVELELDGTVVATETSDGESYISFELSADLAEGQQLRARQLIDGHKSDWSASVTVTRFTGTLPAPVIDPALIYQCGSRIGVRSTIPGVLLTAYQNGAQFQDKWTDSTQKIAMEPGPMPWDIGDVFTAEASLCDQKSPLSDPVTAVPAPEGLPPARVDPNPPYEGQEFTLVRDLAYGAHAEVTVAGATDNTCAAPWGVSCSYSFVDSAPNRNLFVGDIVRNRPVMRCPGPFGPQTNSLAALPCTDLPPPLVTQPTTGDDSIFVSGTVFGARIRVFDLGGNEIADGAPPQVFMDPPATVPAVPIVVVQQVGTCIGTLGRMITPKP